MLDPILDLRSLVHRAEWNVREGHNQDITGCVALPVSDHLLESAGLGVQLSNLCDASVTDLLEPADLCSQLDGLLLVCCPLWVFNFVSCGLLLGLSVALHEGAKCFSSWFFGDGFGPVESIHDVGVAEEGHGLLLLSLFAVFQRVSFEILELIRENMPADV